MTERTPPPERTPPLYQLRYSARYITSDEIHFFVNKCETTPRGTARMPPGRSIHKRRCGALGCEIMAHELQGRNTRHLATVVWNLHISMIVRLFTAGFSFVKLGCRCHIFGIVYSMSYDSHRIITQGTQHSRTVPG